MPTGPSTPGNPPVDGPDGAGFRPGTVVDRTIGRLFFVDRGEDASCTATIVGPGVIVTAGHCVHGFDLLGENPQWTTQVLFVPGFRDGAMPYGSLTPRSVVVHSKWVENDENIGYDQAFLAVDTPPGLQQGIAFDVPAERPVQEFGYPRAARLPGHQGRPEFTGQRVARCWGTARRDVSDAGNWGVPCDMGGGSSGGPRLTSFNEAIGFGTVVGVDTRSAYLDASGECDSQQAGCIRHLVGPQFTSAISGVLYAQALHNIR
jgi:hypothetical protein